MTDVAGWGLPRTGRPDGTALSPSAEPAGRDLAARPEDGDLRALVERAQTGDAAAFERLVTQFERPVRIYVARLIGDDQHAQDLTQEVFWTAWNRLLELREPARFKAWLFRVATNRARSWLRQRHLTSWLSLDWLTSHAEGSGQEAERAAGNVSPRALTGDGGFEERLGEIEALARALRRVPLTYRTCLLLHLSLGFTVPEVAEQLNLAPGAVRMRLCRGLAQLREAYRIEEQ